MQHKPPPLQASARMKALMSGYYKEAKEAEGHPDKKIAWITSGGPVEILYAAGVIPIYPENHAALCGTLRRSDRLSDVAEEQGYSRDLCSYARTDLGALYTGKSPIGGSPKPDFLVCSNNICGTVIKWYQELQRIFDVPLIFIDSPFQTDQDSPEAIDYVKLQLEDMIRQVGEITGTPINQVHLFDCLDRSEKAMDLWRDIQGLLAHRPAPINSFDTFLLMGPIVTLRGTQECIDFYEALYGEIQERIAAGVSTVEKEAFRLGWDNLAIWHKIKFLSQKFANHHAALVVSTYTLNFCYQSVNRFPEDRLRTLAADYLGGYINHGLPFRERELARMVEQFALDGMIIHSNRSCRAYSLGQYDLAKTLEEKYNTPCLMIEADQNDTRCWSEEQIATRIDAFMETLSLRG